MTDKSWRNSIC